VIDNSAEIETPTEKLIDELKMASPQEVEAIYSAQKVLTFQTSPLRAPLIPLPYGETTQTSGRVYGTLQEESLKINQALLPMGTPGCVTSVKAYGDQTSPIEMIKSICQACFDVPKLRNEVYCQAIKMTTGFPEPGSPLNLMHWHLLGSLCSSFLPSRKFVRFLRFHLRRTLEQRDMNGDEVCECAQFCLDALTKTKNRDFPPSSDEIKGIMSGKGLVAQVHVIGGQTIALPVQSNTTVGQVLTEIKTQLDLTECSNGFGLFESCGFIDKYLEEKVMIADTLSKWEKYIKHGIGTSSDGDQWKFVFKLFSFYDPLNAKLSTVEQEFLFEQAFESVMNRRYPADDPMLVELAALRTQYTVGDWMDGAYISDLIKVHPAQQPQLLVSSSSGGTIVGTLKGSKKKSFGTLRGFSKGTLKKLRGDGTMRPTVEVDDKVLAKIKDQIVKAWKKLNGLTSEEARIKFMDIIKTWNGYGANLFEVEQVSNPKWPKELWLAISLEGVGIYPRYERKPLAFYRYETVLSFGAPVANKYKIMIDGVGSMLFETNMVLEIAKLMKEYIKTIVQRRNTP
jgi:myosin X